MKICVICGYESHPQICADLKDCLRRQEERLVAFRTAIKDVKKAIPGGELIEVGPDLVNLTDLSELLGSTKQNFQKYAEGKMRTVSAEFPSPVHFGRGPVYRMYEVVKWLIDNTAFQPDRQILDISRVSCRVNVETQLVRMELGTLVAGKSVGERRPRGMA